MNIKRQPHGLPDPVGDRQKDVEGKENRLNVLDSYRYHLVHYLKHIQISICLYIFQYQRFHRYKYFQYRLLIVILKYFGPIL